MEHDVGRGAPSWALTVSTFEIGEQEGLGQLHESRLGRDHAQLQRTQELGTQDQAPLRAEEQKPQPRRVVNETGVPRRAQLTVGAGEAYSQRWL